MDWRSYSIGVAMIARNNCTTIERALVSVRGIAQQIVVVDTGSTDVTPQIATRFGADVYFHTWQNDFSQARNYALGYLRTEWVLVLDTDEELDRASLHENLPLLADASIGGIEVSIVNPLAGDTFSEHRYTRLFRRHPNVYFRGTIHEQVAESIRNAGSLIVPSTIRILHYGYSQLSPEKISRNIELLRAEIAIHPESTWHRYHLGLAEFAAGNIRNARELLEPLWQDMQLSTQQQEIARIRCAQCALACDDLLRAEQLLSFVSGDDSREGLRLFVMAAVLAAQRQFQQAVEVLQLPVLCRSRLIDQKQRVLFIERLSNLINSTKATSRRSTLTTTTIDWKAMFQ